MRQNTLFACCCTALLMWGCGASSSTTSTVTGTVLDESDNPVANALVLVLGGSGQPVTTDASGTFSIPEVAATYDIAVASSTRTSAIVYKGVSLRSLSLHLTSGLTPSFSNSTTVSGNVSGGQTPYTNTTTPSVTFYTPQLRVAIATVRTDISGHYSLEESWAGSPAPVTGSLHAFQTVRGTGTVPASYTAYGRLDNVILTPNSPVSGDLKLDPVASSTLGFGVVVPSGLSLLTNRVFFTGQGDVRFPLFSQSKPSGSSFSYPVPQVPQATFAVTVSASPVGSDLQVSVTKTGLTAGSSDTTLTLPAPVQLHQPENLATNVLSTTDFSWSGMPGGIHGLFLDSSSSTDTPYSMTVITADTHISLPDLTALGMPLPGNISLQWSVQGNGLRSSVDALLQLASGTSPRRPVLRDSITTGSETRSFTTAPTP